MNRQKHLVLAALDKYKRESDLYSSLLLNNICDLFGSIDKEDDIQNIIGILINTNVKQLIAITDSAKFIFNNEMSSYDRMSILEPLSKMKADQIRAVGSNSQTFLSNINSYSRQNIIESLSALSGEEIQELFDTLRQAPSVFLYESLRGYAKHGLICVLTKVGTKRVKEVLQLIQKKSEMLFRYDMSGSNRSDILQKVLVLSNDDIESSLSIIYKNYQFLLDKENASTSTRALTALLGKTADKIRAIAEFVERIFDSEGQDINTSFIIAALAKLKTSNIIIINNHFANFFYGDLGGCNGPVPFRSVVNIIDALKDFKSSSSLKYLSKNTHLFFDGEASSCSERAAIIQALSDKTPMLLEGIQNFILQNKHQIHFTPKIIVAISQSDLKFLQRQIDTIVETKNLKLASKKEDLFLILIDLSIEQIQTIDKNLKKLLNSSFSGHDWRDKIFFSGIKQISKKTPLEINKISHVASLFYGKNIPLLVKYFVKIFGFFMLYTHISPSNVLEVLTVLSQKTSEELESINNKAVNMCIQELYIYREELYREVEIKYEHIYS